MILQSLSELYSRLAEDPAYEIAPPGFSPQKISFRIVIKPDGSLVQIDDARIKDSRGKLFPDRIEVPAHEKRTSGIKPQFLCDKPEYVLGWTPDTNKQSHANACFDSFKKLHLSKEKEINDPSYSAICRFLEQWSPQKAKDYPILAEIGTNFGIWALQGEKKPIHRSSILKKWWIENQITKSTDRNIGQCLVSGELSSICRIHPDIKGFKNSIALVGIQENTSYESYGLSKTENCPVSETVAFRYSTALNALTDGPKRNKHRIRIGGTSVVHWTEKPSLVEDAFAGIFADYNVPDDAQDKTTIVKINLLLRAIKSGHGFEEIGEPNTGFFILGLEQPNPGRFSIRFFHRSTTADLLAKLHAHHRSMEMVRQFTEETGSRFPDPEFPAIWQILRETARVADEIPPLLGGALTRSIVEGTPYPEGLFAAIIRRIQADRTINYLRAATLKAVLVRNHNQNISIMLDTEKKDSAYLHGRLFAALEKIQEEGYYAQNKQQIRSTIKEKYFSSASATPAAVFPRLETLSVHHQRHLNVGRKIYFEKLIAEIKWNVSKTNKTHTLVEQGNFILGYYHQRKDFFNSKDTDSIEETN